MPEVDLCVFVLRKVEEHLRRGGVQVPAGGVRAVQGELAQDVGRGLEKVPDFCRNLQK